jgi:uncharacterized protein (TIGR00369 family)
MHDPATELDPELRAAISHYFERIPFNQMLGIRLEQMEAARASIHMPMRPELIGNFSQGILHGGVIATLLDVVGGLMAMIGAFSRDHHLPQRERMAKLAKLGTIDMRVDYLRPGRGQAFTATAVLLRTGNKVAVVRSELHADDGTLIAAGTGTYLCG